MKEAWNKLFGFCIDHKLWFASDEYMAEFWAEFDEKYPEIAKKKKV